MNHKWLIGKTIEKVITRKIQPRHSESTKDTELNQLHFTDGSYAYFVALESDFEPYVVGQYVPKPKRKEVK